MKKHLIAIVFIAGIFPVIAQNYFQGAGFQTSVRIRNTPNDFDDFDISNSFGFFYKATYAFNKPFYPQLAVSAYPMIGFGASIEGFSPDFQLPVTAEVYFGDVDDVNFFAGVGFCAGVSPIISSDPYVQTKIHVNSPVLGPQISAGTQFDMAAYVGGVRTSFTHILLREKSVDNLGIETQDRRFMITLGVFFVL